MTVDQDPDAQPPPGSKFATMRAWLEARDRRIFIRGDGGERLCLADVQGEPRAFWLGWLCCRIALGAPVYVLRES